MVIVSAMGAPPIRAGESIGPTAYPGIQVNAPRSSVTFYDVQARGSGFGCEPFPPTRSHSSEVTCRIHRRR